MSKEEGEAKEEVGKEVEEEGMKVGLRREDGLYRSKWSVA